MRAGAGLRPGPDGVRAPFRMVWQGTLPADRDDWLAFVENIPLPGSRLLPTCVWVDRTWGPRKHVPVTGSFHQQAGGGGPSSPLGQWSAGHSLDGQGRFATGYRNQKNTQWFRWSADQRTRFRDPRLPVDWRWIGGRTGARRQPSRHLLVQRFGLPADGDAVVARRARRVPPASSVGAGDPAARGTGAGERERHGRMGRGTAPIQIHRRRGVARSVPSGGRRPGLPVETDPRHVHPGGRHLPVVASVARAGPARTG